MPGKTALKVAKNLAFLLVGLVLLYFAFRGNDLGALWHDMRQAKYSWVFLSLLMGVLAYVSRGLRWLILLEPLGYKPKISTSIYSIIIGYFANLAIPRIGELTRCTTMSQVEKIPVDKLFGTVILERIIDMVMLVTLTFITILVKVDVFGAFFLDLFNANKDKYPQLFKLLGFAAACGVLFLLMAYFIRERLRRYPFVVRLKNFLLGLKEGLLSLRKIKNHPAFWFHTVCIWLFYYLMSWVVFYSIPETAHLSWLDGLFILVVGGFGMAAPVQGGIGAYHLIVSMGLTVLGVSQTAALTYATIVHTSQTLLVMLAGSIAFGLVYYGVRKSKQSTVSA